MKLTRKNTTILQVAGIILVVGLTSILMFKPEIVPGLNKETRSISSLIKKKEEIDSLNNQLESTDSNLTSIKNELEGIEGELVSTEIESERLRKGIEDTNFEYHLPSIMVMLEQKAKELNLEFSLDYDRIQTLTGGDVAHDFEEEHLDETEHEETFDEEVEEQEEFDGPQGGEDEAIHEDISPLESIEDSELGESGRPKVDMSELTKNLPDIPGINITSIPIEVTGSYGNIRLFIEFLDEIDLLEHNIVDLYSFGKDISAVIAFNVYHTSDSVDGSDSEGIENYEEYEEQQDYEDDFEEEIEGGDDY